MAFHGVPGLSIAVFQNGELSWSAAYGVADVETGRPVTPDTYFQAASISKAITAFAAMKLVEDDILLLDAPVNSQLKSWQLEENTFTDGEPVTLRHLLSHMAGLNVSGFAGYAKGEPRPTLLQILNGTPPAKNERVAVVEKPGERIKYSGGGTQIVEAVIVDQTNESFGDVVARTVFSPIGMTRSFVGRALPEDQQAQAARGHVGLGAEPIDGFSHFYREFAAGGAWSNPTDLARLGIAFTKALNGDERSFIAPNTAREMIKGQINGAGSLGPFVWQMPDGEMFGHTGGNAGYRNNFYGFTDGRGGAVIMTNADNGFALIWEVMAALSETYGWSYGATKVRDAIRLTPEIAERVSGRYQTELSWVGDMIITIENRDGELWMIAPPILPQTPLYHEGATTFFLNTGQQVVLDEDEHGNILGLNTSLETGLYARRIPDVVAPSQ